MSTISAGKLVANSLVHLGDRTGALVFQTNGSTTALTLDSEQNATFSSDVTVNGNLTVNGTTTSFGDNDRINLGAGNDLQIYHDGSNSYIDDAGTGSLKIRGSQINLEKYTGETLISAVADGAVSLYYDNSTKLVTTNNGIQTTGTISVNGAYTLPTTDGSANQALVTDGAGALSFANVSLTPQVITANTNAVAGNHYFLDSAGITLTLPSSPSAGDRIGVTELVGDTTSVIAGNGNNIMKDSADLTIDTAYLILQLAYTGDSSVGWAFA